MATARLLRLSGSFLLVALIGTLGLKGVFSQGFVHAEVIDSSIEPSVVEQVEAFPGDGEVMLTWDAATDNEGVSGYYVYTGIESVENLGGAYTFGSEDAGNTTTTTVENLSNGTTYYFAVTAYDADGNESPRYSNEAEATPESSEVADFTAPTVKKASALTSTLVEVLFSEPVQLPSEPSSAFALESMGGVAIQILDAYVSDDPSTVFLVTEEQDANEEYILTAGISVQDFSGNPVESGTSDTATFTGSALHGDSEPDASEPDVNGEDGDATEQINEAFKVETVEAVEANELVIIFSQKPLPPDPDSFTIELLEDASEKVEVLAVSVDEEDEMKLTLSTQDMQAGYEYVLSIDEDLVNSSGESMSEGNRSVEFTAKTLDFADVIAPEDVTKFLAKALNETTAALSWEPSANTAGDLAKYLLYRSSDGGLSFGEALQVSKEVASSGLVEYDVDGLTPGASYTFKVTAVDENGNESEGVLVNVTLPEAGPELLLLGVLSLLGGWLWTRRRSA